MLVPDPGVKLILVQGPHTAQFMTTPNVFVLVHISTLWKCVHLINHPVTNYYEQMEFFKRKLSAIFNTIMPQLIVSIVHYNWHILVDLQRHKQLSHTYLQLKNIVHFMITTTCQGVEIVLNLCAFQHLTSTSIQNQFAWFWIVCELLRK